jgi:hypothetical protein
MDRFRVNHEEYYEKKIEKALKLGRDFFDGYLEGYQISPDGKTIRFENDARFTSSLVHPLHLAPHLRKAYAEGHAQIARLGLEGYRTLVFDGQDLGKQRSRADYAAALERAHRQAYFFKAILDEL